MKEIIEKYKKGNLDTDSLIYKSGFVLQGNDEIVIKWKDVEDFNLSDDVISRTRVKSSAQLDKEIAAVEQSKQYKYEELNLKSDIEKAKAFIELDDLYVFTSGVVHGDLERDTYKVKSLTDICVGKQLYRRIELTQEELHEQRVGELAKAIKAGNPIGQDIPYHEMSSTHLDAYVEMARAALEWMKQERGE